MEFKYLAMNDWEDYQTSIKNREWIKDSVGQRDRSKFASLSFFESGLLQELRRVRGRTGRNIENDITHIALATHAKGTDRPHLRHAIDTLISRRILILTNEQFSPLEERRGEETRVEEEVLTPVRKAHGKPLKKPSEVTPVDSRHIRMKSLICNAYEQQNKAQCPWDGSEGSQLKRFLDSTPNWADSQVAQCLVNMYDSVGFAKGTRPREFLPRLPKYLNGPLNEFNREQSNVGTRPVSKADAREQRIIERAITHRTLAAGAANSAGDGQMAFSGNGATGIRGLDGEPEIMSAGKYSGSVRPLDVRAAKT
jgi:hypothetical protein